MQNRPVHIKSKPRHTGFLLWNLEVGAMRIHAIRRVAMPGSLILGDTMLSQTHRLTCGGESLAQRVALKRCGAKLNPARHNIAMP